MIEGEKKKSTIIYLDVKTTWNSNFSFCAHSFIYCLTTFTSHWPSWGAATETKRPIKPTSKTLTTWRHEGKCADLCSRRRSQFEVYPTHPHGPLQIHSRSRRNSKVSYSQRTGASSHKSFLFHQISILRQPRYFSCYMGLRSRSLDCVPKRRWGKAEVWILTLVLKRPCTLVNRIPNQSKTPIFITYI